MAGAISATYDPPQWPLAYIFNSDLTAITITDADIGNNNACAHHLCNACT
jgi:hypothetical protein